MSGHPSLSPAADIISAGAIVASFLQLLPPLAAVIAILWYCLEIYESKTIQGWIRARRRRHFRRMRRLHRKPPPTDQE